MWKHYRVIKCIFIIIVCTFPKPHLQSTKGPKIIAGSQSCKPLSPGEKGLSDASRHGPKASQRGLAAGTMEACAVVILSWIEWWNSKQTAARTRPALHKLEFGENPEAAQQRGAMAASGLHEGLAG